MASEWAQVSNVGYECFSL